MVYGSTFKLDDKMDIIINTDKKIEMTSDDKEKVQQDFKVLFRTILGDNICHTDLGINFVAITGALSTKAIENEIRKTASQYRFLKSVDNVLIGQDKIGPGEWRQTWTVTVTLLNDEEITFTI